MAENKEQLQNLREYLTRTKGSRYPFTGHWLAQKVQPVQTSSSGSDGYGLAAILGEAPKTKTSTADSLKNPWLTMLCMLLQSEDSVSAEQKIFVQRLITGCSAEHNLETYMSQGLEVTPEILENFFEMMLDNTAEDADVKRYSFVMDAMLMLHVGEADERADELLAQLCEALRLTPDEMTKLASVCANILQMDAANCIRCDVETPLEMFLFDLWKVYLPDWDRVLTLDTESCLIKAASQPLVVAEETLADMGGVNISLRSGDGSYNYSSVVTFSGKSTLCLWNLEIPMTYHLCFQNIQRVVLVNCEFVNDDSSDYSVLFVNCGEVIMEDCLFQNCSGRAIYAVNSKNIQIRDCAFWDCDVRHDSNRGELGGVIYGVEEDTLLVLRDTEFIDCGGHNLRRNDCYCSSIISNCRAIIENCCFENCWHYSYNEYRSSSDRWRVDPDNSDRCLFRHIHSETDNTLINSAQLGPH